MINTLHGRCTTTIASQLTDRSTMCLGHRRTPKIARRCITVGKVFPYHDIIMSWIILIMLDPIKIPAKVQFLNKGWCGIQTMVCMRVTFCSFVKKIEAILGRLTLLSKRPFLLVSKLNCVLHAACRLPGYAAADNLTSNVDKGKIHHCNGFDFHLIIWMFYHNYRSKNYWLKYLIWS